MPRTRLRRSPAARLASVMRAVDDGLGRAGIGPQAGPGQAEVEGEVHQLRLEPVVQVAFDAPPFGFG